MSAPPEVASQERLLRALETVRDPELDEPITSLGFVASCAVSADGDAEVRLRLPTYFCAPNFAYLMVADAYDAVSVLPGVRRTSVVLEDHFASDAINDGVAAQVGFVNWEMPAREEFADYPKLGTAGKKKILGLNAAKLYGIEVPAEYQLKDDSPAAQDDAQLVSGA